MSLGTAAAGTASIEIRYAESDRTGNRGGEGNVDAGRPDPIALPKLETLLFISSSALNYLHDHNR